MSPEYLQRFGALARLYGHPALEAFHRGHVAVVGIGGVGSWVAEALARSGIGTLTLMDLDDICITNTNRQIHTTRHTIGQSKSRAMAQRLQAINPEIRIAIQEAFYAEATQEALFSQPFDLLVDAIDSVRHKAHLLDAARRHDRPVITVGGAGGRIDPSRIRLGDLSRTSGDRLLMLVRKKLRGQYGFPRANQGSFRIPAVYSDEPPRFPWADGTICFEREPASPGGLDCASGLGSVTHLTATMGLHAAAAVLRQIAAAPENLH